MKQTKKQQKLFIMLAILIITFTFIRGVSAFTQSDIVAHITFDENTTSLLNSVSPVYNATVTSGTVYINTSAGVCKRGGCRNYTASGDIINLHGLTNLTAINGKITINYWVYLRDANQYDKTIHFASSSGGSSPQIYSDWNNICANQWEFASYNVNSNFMCVNNSYVQNLTMMTYTNNGSHAQVYINGELYRTNTTGFPIPTTSQLNFIRIGNDLASPTRAINGLMDEFTILNNSVTASEVQQFINYAYPFQAIAGTPTFLNKTPSDINTFNAVGVPTIIYYNYSGLGFNTSNLSSIKLNFTTQGGIFVINGTSYAGQDTRNAVNCSSDICAFIIGDNQIYPATYNVNETVMESTPHNYFSLSNNNILKTQIMNMSVNKTFNVLEVMVNSTSQTIIYYCNSSYTTGVPILNPNCALISEQIFSTFNHSHNYSRHNVFSLPIISGKIGNITFTNTSYILVRSTLSGSAQVGYINGSQRTGMTQSSNNNGISYTEQNITPDIHIHLFDGSENFTFSSYGYNASSVYFTSTTQSDNIGITNLNPTSPMILGPQSQIFTWSDNLNISWIQSSPASNNAYITNYNVTLHDELYTLKRTINYGNNTTTTLNNVNNWTGLKTGTYFIKITSLDNNSLTSYSYSEPLYLQSILYEPCNSTVTLNSTGVNVYFNWSTDPYMVVDEVIAKLNNISYGFTVSTQGDNSLIGTSSSNYTLYFSQEFNDSSTDEYNSGCYLYLCVNDWERTNEPCVSNLRLINYTDLSSCAQQYDKPSDANTYEDCTLPANTDKELWFILLLLLLWILSIIVCLLWFRLFVIVTFLLGVFIWYFTGSYFNTNVIGIVVNITNLFILILALTFRKD